MRWWIIVESVIGASSSNHFQTYFSLSSLLVRNLQHSILLNTVVLLLYHSRGEWTHSANKICKSKNSLNIIYYILWPSPRGSRVPAAAIVLNNHCHKHIHSSVRYQSQHESFPMLWFYPLLVISHVILVISHQSLVIMVLDIHSFSSSRENNLIHRHQNSKMLISFSFHFPF
jgi:hypothetical protein